MCVSKFEHGFLLGCILHLFYHPLGVAK